MNKEVEEESIPHFSTFEQIEIKPIDFIKF